MISIETSNLLFFIGASLLLIIAPGPDIVFLVAQGVTRGPRAGFATAMGLAAGNLVHTTAAALGVSGVFRASPVAFHALKLAGVVYLLYLAWRTLRDTKGPLEDAVPDRTATGAVAVEVGATSLFWRGLLMNVLNPKVALFFLAFLPQFTSPSVGPIGAQMVLYGVLFTLLVVVVFGALGIISGLVLRGSVSGRLGTRPRAFRWVVVIVYVALAVRLAMA
jgi:threonine/homoserine/homoserine lactone efflux protein